MSIEPIKREVTQLLSQANERVREAEKALANGTDEQKVRASGQLVFLKRQKAALEARVAELDASRDGGGRTVLQWFKEDWMVLMHRLDAFIDGH